MYFLPFLNRPFFRQKNALGGMMGCMMMLAVRCGGRITLFLDQPGAGKWVPDGKSGLCDATAESETVHPATKLKVKSRGKKGEIFLFVFSLHSPSREVCGWDGLWGQRKIRIHTQPGALEGLPPNRGLVSWATRTLICRNSWGWRQFKVPDCLF